MTPLVWQWQDPQLSLYWLSTAESVRESTFVFGPVCICL